VESFVVLEALENCETLEHFKTGWLEYTGSDGIALKHALIDEVAGMSRLMHQQGINHRDFYLNHFLINRDIIRNWQPGDSIPLHLIDLHRLQQRPTVPRRWLVKDLGSLVFSALDVGLTSADCARYLRVYLGSDWSASLRKNHKLWQAIIKRACKLYQRFHNKAPKLPKLLQIR